LPKFEITGFATPLTLQRARLGAPEGTMIHKPGLVRRHGKKVPPAAYFIQSAGRTAICRRETGGAGGNITMACNKSGRPTD